MRLSLRRVQPGAVFSSFFGILDIKLGECCVVRAACSTASPTHYLLAYRC